MLTEILLLLVGFAALLAGIGVALLAALLLWWVDRWLPEWLAWGLIIALLLLLAWWLGQVVEMWGMYG